ncbi:helix-turn-helix domain-containing protein [Haloactinomyces albus]|uniref:DNA-binding transcriptional MerR regulator n=1 Tax=Haloactinomyces albus TaxID=1352928 RepID=A0AAE4CKZ8_9ACTN|nr:MerR family transcriptional regulator [Haloactinomyces albus]MDR7301690.1 DNA-binding transcriptional MerR regulator [Haloactinomyces albus]
MDDTEPYPNRLYTIGELARRTGLTVKTIRFYSDSGVVPPTDRTHSGYRLYSVETVARLELVRTLRELGAGLADIERVLAKETSLRQLADAHLSLIEERMSLLRTRRAVLRAVVKQDSTTEEMGLMHKLAQMSDEERNRLIDEFWDSTTEGLNVNPEFVAWMRSAKPNLPEDPSAEQVEAWIELAELVQDSDFRRLVRDLNAEQARLRDTGEGPDTSQDRAEGGLDVLDEIVETRKSGTAPDSDRARALIDQFAGTIAQARATEDDARFREALAIEFEQHDPRLTRYWELLGTINGWPRRGMLSVDDTAWLVDALRASAQ